MPARLQHDSKTRLLDASLQVIRAKGYAATTVDDICHEAGVTKGSFFHHFKSKDCLAVAVADHWSTLTEALFAAAPYHQASVRWRACSAMSTSVRRSWRANYRITPVCSAPWCRRLTPPTRRSVPPAIAACPSMSPS